MIDTDMSVSEKLERAGRLIKAATGESWGDGYTVTDMGAGIAEPGYGTEETVWVLGDWNPKRWLTDEERSAGLTLAQALTKAESLPVRLAEALERRVPGIELHWLDEWTTCDDCRQIFRTQADSYSWLMFGAFTEDGTYCANHLSFDDIAEEYINVPTKALTFPLNLEEEGFSLYGSRYENGWHPGQDDDPKAILAEALRSWREGIFKISSSGQFDIEFELWVRGERTYCQSLSAEDGSACFKELTEDEEIESGICVDCADRLSASEEGSE